MNKHRKMHQTNMKILEEKWQDALRDIRILKGM